MPPISTHPYFVIHLLSCLLLCVLQGWRRLPFTVLPFLPVFFDRFYRFTVSTVKISLPFYRFAKNKPAPTLVCCDVLCRSARGIFPEPPLMSSSIRNSSQIMNWRDFRGGFTNSSQFWSICHIKSVAFFTSISVAFLNYPVTCSLISYRLKWHNAAIRPTDGRRDCKISLSELQPKICTLRKRTSALFFRFAYEFSKENGVLITSLNSNSSMI